LNVWSARPVACQLTKLEDAVAVILPVGALTRIPGEHEGSFPPETQ
jgi:hypothetical protein